MKKSLRFLSMLFVLLLSTLSMSAQENIYLFGDVTDPAWKTNVGIKMDYVDGAYTTTIDLGETEHTVYFAFITELAETDSDWDFVNSRRYGAVSDGTAAGPTASIVKKGEAAFKLTGSGKYVFTFTFSSLTVVPEGYVAPAVGLYLIGNHDGNEFSPNDNTCQLVYDSEADVYTREAVAIDGYIAFATVLGSDESDWSTLNSNRWGPAVANTEIISGVETAIGMNGDVSFKVAQGIYNIVVSLTNGTIMMTDITPEPGIYLIGYHDGKLMLPNDASCRLQYDELNDVYYINNVVFDDNNGGISYLAFSSTLGLTDSDWATFNVGRLGPIVGSEDELLFPGTPAAFISYSNASYSIEAGTYDIVLSFTAGTVTVKKSNTTALKNRKVDVVKTLYVDLSGVVSETPHKGMNVVRTIGADGSEKISKKLFR